MADHQWLVERFEAHRVHLRSVAYRMLGSSGEADDAVQEAWLRLSRSDATDIENLGGCLTTVVSRVSLDMLRSRATRREDPAGTPPDDEAADPTSRTDPEHEAVLADTVGSALLVVLDTLSPAERLAFVLHDVFAVPFDEIGAIVNRSSNGPGSSRCAPVTRCRGRTPLRTPIPPASARSSTRSWPPPAVATSTPWWPCSTPTWCSRRTPSRYGWGHPPRSGARPAWRGRSQDGRWVQPALIDGAVGVVWAVDGRLKVAWDFTLEAGRIVHIDMLAAPDSLSDLDYEILETHS